MTQEQFLKLTSKGNLIPVYQEVLADLETPVSAYFKIASKAEYSFLLESVEGEEKVSRFSFLARDPELVFESKNNSVKILSFGKKRTNIESRKLTFGQTPLTEIREIMKKYRFVSVPELPRFCGGLVGYLSYDIVRFFEKLPLKTKDDLKLPETLLMLAKNMIIFDHRKHTLTIVNCAYIPSGSSSGFKVKLYKKALEEIQRLLLEIQAPLKSHKNKARRKSVESLKLRVQSNVTKAEFEQSVRDAKKQILAGEIIQVVLSQRFGVDLKVPPFNVYRALRLLNPSPYMYYLHFGDIQIIGSSPELLVRCENGIVETRPIAGTRRRGRDEKEDLELAKELLADPKEKAEHIMLVDLGRNDLGRVCEQGTVKISEFMQVEKYSHVMHIVSNVQGELKHGQDSLDVLQAAFPAGTVSGAPKIRAMEIIEDLEKVRRGPYAGCIGYFSFSGNLDTCITIRTIVVHGKKAFIQAGAGIVADSKPEKEYQETMNKAKAQLKAIELAYQN